jgi:hypothetical protein
MPFSLTVGNDERFGEKPNPNEPDKPLPNQIWVRGVNCTHIFQYALQHSGIWAHLEMQSTDCRANVQQQGKETGNLVWTTLLTITVAHDALPPSVGITRYCGMPQNILSFFFVLPSIEDVHRDK